MRNAPENDDLYLWRAKPLKKIENKDCQKEKQKDVIFLMPSATHA